MTLSCASRPSTTSPCKLKSLKAGRKTAPNSSGSSGEPSVNLAVAARYLHSHNSMIERRDLDRAVDLLVDLLPLLDAKTVADISHF